jgi:N-acyl-L-homoserine lactone synthetase
MIISKLEVYDKYSSMLKVFDEHGNWISTVEVVDHRKELDQYDIEKLVHLIAEKCKSM